MSEEVKHTPGPWKVCMSGSFETEVRSPSGRRVAATWVQGPAKSPQGNLNQGRVNEANARLISAAPDLLEAVKAFISYEQLDEDDHASLMLAYADMLAKSRAAIAKAEGRSA